MDSMGPQATELKISMVIRDSVIHFYSFDGKVVRKLLTTNRFCFARPTLQLTKSTEI